MDTKLHLLLDEPEYYKGLNDPFQAPDVINTRLAAYK